MSGSLAADILGAALICAALSMILKSFGFRGAPIFVAVALVGISSFGISALSGIFSEVEYIAQLGGVEKYAAAAIKIVGTQLLCGIGADTLTELGEGGIAKAASLAGKVEILLIAMPYLSEIINEVVGFLGV